MKLNLGDQGDIFGNAVLKKVGATYNRFHKGLIVPPQLLELNQPDLETTGRNGVVFRQGKRLPCIPNVYRILTCTTVTFLALRATEVAEAPADRPNTQKLAKRLGNYVRIKGVLGEIKCSDGYYVGPNCSRSGLRT